MMLLTYFYKLSLSLLLSALVGSEREKQHKPAGLRTIMLVCLGATLFAIISQTVPMGMTRMLQGTITGIGFLGSGVIIFNKGSVEGITTAGVLWVIVAIGLACGLALYELSIVSSIAIWLILKLKYILRDD